jgi:uncharacterized protein
MAEVSIVVPPPPPTDRSMTSDDALRILGQHLPELRQRFGVRSLAVFGSVSRNEATADSDVDLLVGFEGPATFDGFMGLKWQLEDLLGCRVDLVTENAVRPELRPRIEREAIRVA